MNVNNITTMSMDLNKIAKRVNSIFNLSYDELQEKWEKKN